ncbi:hypothetical protein OLACOIGA_00032 [Enterococcus phage vB_Efa29212_2e]|nr:hypothetical protein OLACOIGA_00032 [Enterococcus phage vB_Efa29212_2e]
MDFQKGTVKRTQGQVKKHASHFTPNEVKQLYKAKDRVKDLWLKRGIKIGFHLQDKIRNGETKFSYEITMKTMLNSTIVEYNETGADKRILLRSHISHNGNVQCIVISLISGKVITSYLNDVYDRHKTLDPRRYDKNLKINLPKHLTK